MNEQNTELQPTTKSPFDQIVQTGESGNEYWSARDLMTLLGYVEWRKFEGAIERAKQSLKNTGAEDLDHFVPSAKMVQTGSGAGREITDYHLSRFACYLVAMNGDPRKPEIAAAQAYFAIKTHEAELAPLLNGDNKKPRLFPVKPPSPSYLKASRREVESILGAKEGLEFYVAALWEYHPVMASSYQRILDRVEIEGEGIIVTGRRRGSKKPSLSEIQRYVKSTLERQGQVYADKVETELLNEYYPTVARAKQTAQRELSSREYQINNYGWKWDVIQVPSIRQWLEAETLELPPENYFKHYHAIYLSWCEEQQKASIPGVDFRPAKAISFSKCFIAAGAEKIRRDRDDGWWLKLPKRNHLKAV